MAEDINNITLTGRLGRDPEHKVTPGGKSVVNFSLASNTGFGDKEKANWFNVVAWEKLADTCAKFLHKGDPIAIVGQLTTRDWEDKEGNKRTTTEIVIRNMKMLGTKKEGVAQPVGVVASTASLDDLEDLDDSEIPF